MNTEDDVDTARQDSEVVLVTGGAGFLGQHIVKHVMEQKEFPVREVRVFDIQPLKWFYGLEGRFQSYLNFFISHDDILLSHIINLRGKCKTKCSVTI